MEQVTTGISGRMRQCIQLIVFIVAITSITVNGWLFTAVHTGSLTAPASMGPSTSGCRLLPQCSHGSRECTLQCSLECRVRGDSCFGFYSLQLLCCMFNVSAFVKQQPWVGVTQQCDIYARKVSKLTFIGCSQSSNYSTHSYSTCQAAIDGNTNPDFFSQSCTHTLDSSNQWWQGQLADVSLVSYVTIYNRNTAQSRLQYFSLQMDNVECNSVNLMLPFLVSMNFTCMKSGRKVKVLSLQPNTPLTMCEIEVYGVVNK